MLKNGNKTLELKLFLSTKATDSMKMTMTHATLERNKAVQEMARIKKHSERYQKDLEQVE